MMKFLGIDTSNYTTSVALFDGTSGRNCSCLLDVKPGELGLRQSDALFAHVKRLPELFARLFEAESAPKISGIGVSTRPRAVEGSYMPCFLAGVSQAEVLATALQVPLYQFSHQQGHIAASLWSSERMELMKMPHLAWHLSGGTTELLLVEPDNKNVKTTKIGGTTDISAGQLIDRTGKLLGLQFPAGKALDTLSSNASGDAFFRVKCKEQFFSLSGAENKVQDFSKAHDAAEVAAYTLRTVCHAVVSATRQACRLYPDLPVVFSGGVASNAMLRTSAVGFDAVFCEAQYSTDNALGTAVLAWLQENG